MKKKTKKTYGKQIVAGLLVAIMLLLEVVTIFAAETNETTPIIATESVATNDIFESVMAKQLGFTLNDDFITFPTTVPELIGSSNKIYSNIVQELNSECIATYRSNDNLFTVVFENPTDKTIDMNKAIVRSIEITPQLNTTLKISGLEMDNNTIVSEADLIKVFGEYDKESSYKLTETSDLFSWNFDTYVIAIILKDNTIDNILVTNKEDTLPNVSKDSFYNFESGEYYKIEIFENKINIGTNLATTFYVTKDEKDSMASRLFFDLYINNVYPMGYLLQNETIDELNANNDYEAVLAELSRKMELDFYSNNATFIEKSDYEIERENNIRYIIVSAVLAFAVIVLIVYEKRKKKEKMKRELHNHKEIRKEISGTTGDEE